MCAIAGLYDLTGNAVDLRVLESMTRIQAHRGPDGEGYTLLDPLGKIQPTFVRGSLGREPSLATHDYPLGLGHRRLAVFDLSPRGDQPMATTDGRHWITYNGEIYNYIELREELKNKGYTFRSASDTEVMLAGYLEWGEACLTRFNGMFAFALWDGERHRLFCARDRLGVKPFYYFWDGKRFAFASEIKALLPAMPRPRANERAVFDYLDGAYLDYSDGTFFEGIAQLLPAHYLTVDGNRLTLTRYWDLPNENGVGPRVPEDAAEQFAYLFRDAIRLRLRSDVAIGTCLSGGLDSSSITCVANELMFGDTVVPRQLIGERQKTFSSCFEDPAYDERRFIRPVIERTGAEPYYVFPDPKELVVTMDKLVWQQDEPFGSTSIFAQWNVMRLASQQGIKVLLDGQGADELLCGYHGIFGAFFADLVAKGRWLSLMRELACYRRLHGAIPPHIPANLARALLPRHLIRAVRGRMTGSVAWIAGDFRREWAENSLEPAICHSYVHTLQRQLLTRNGLRALLHYEDRNSMAFGIETRLPFLDYRLVEFLYGLDTGLMIRNGWTKMLLRDAMEGEVPDQVRWRVDKMGFVTPEDVWFRTSLRSVVQDILMDSRTRARGYLDVTVALKEFDAHVAGLKNISSIIWRWLNLELWCRNFLDAQPCAAYSS